MSEVLYNSNHPAVQALAHNIVAHKSPSSDVISNDPITLRRWFNEDKSVGLEMWLHRKAEYYGYKAGAIICVFGLDRSSQDSYDCVSSEHYKPDDLLRAMEAFDERLDPDKMFRRSSKVYSKFRELDHILEKE